MPGHPRLALGSLLISVAEGEKKKIIRKPDISIKSAVFSASMRVILQADLLCYIISLAG